MHVFLMTAMALLIQLQPETHSANEIHINLSVIYYIVGIVGGLLLIARRISKVFKEMREHSDKNLEAAKLYAEKLRDDAVADRKVWIADHNGEHTKLRADQSVAANEIQTEIDALAEKHDSDMHAFRKTIEAVLLEKRDLEGMMRQVMQELTTLSAKVEKVSEAQGTMSTAMARMGERMDIIKTEHGQFHKGESS